MKNQEYFVKREHFSGFGGLYSFGIQKPSFLIRALVSLEEIPMRRTANRLLASCVATTLCISLAGNAQAPAPVPPIPYVAEAKAVIEIAKDIYDFFSNSSNGDTVQLQKDVTWMKEKLNQMDH